MLADAAPPISDSLPQSAVLVALYDDHRDTHVLLTRRAKHLRLHAGEIAFPGGKCDPEDADHWDTALREAEEEVALARDTLEPLGYLAPLVTRTGIQVTPCVARVSSRTDLQANPQELDMAFEAPLAFFADSTQISFLHFDYGGRERRVPQYQWQEHRIWGITAAILVRLVNLACDADIKMDDYWLGREAAPQ
ncbi:MAG: CoA pyrophosphatase [Halieaceae bacterium]|nr:CoA pyrophosphatase [Halieaceae bacterium]